jgi:2-polyprenyl-3-methyl-5-hydroxy-6-metoxy-1,4-benzoquinol methylase
MNQNYTLKQHSLGFYQIDPPPTDEELSAYYEQQYFQNGLGGYELSYTKAELEYNQAIIGDTYTIIEEIQDNNTQKTLLDVGCGEGWTLDYFHKKSWDVLGVDFGDFAIKKYHPHLEKNLIVCDIYENLQKLASQKKTFSAIVLDNVLEHVKNPIGLLELIKTVANKETVFVIKVPNDFSLLQTYLLENNLIEKPYWVAYPDHLAYFTKDSLTAAANVAGWEVTDILADFPIDFFLLNVHSNYYNDRTKGKEAHNVRTNFTNYLHQHSAEKKRNFFRSMASIGLGRQLIAFLQPK